MQGANWTVQYAFRLAIAQPAALKTQASINLNTINFFIQGALAAANNCAEVEALKLYKQADNMLDTFSKSNCGCSGNNYVLNFR